MPVIDVHTHMLSEEWLQRLIAHGGNYDIRDLFGERVIHLNGAPFMTLRDAMFDYAQRIEDMDKVGVDIAIVSLTCPSVFWGGEEVSRATARIMNDGMAAQQKAYPDRIRFFASLPWQYPEAAIEELARACDLGAVGVFVAANISGMSLTDPLIAPIWKAIDDRALPVLVHPSAPPGVEMMDMVRYSLPASVGFMFDTTLAISRMIYDAFFDTYPNLKIIAAHAGATLPYIMGRLDICYDNIPATRQKLTSPPSSYFRRFYYDAVTYTQDALELCLKVAGPDNVMYGSDYPHNIGDMAGCLARVDALPKRQRDKVRGTNAMRIFGL